MRKLTLLITLTLLFATSCTLQGPNLPPIYPEPYYPLPETEEKPTETIPEILRGTFKTEAEFGIWTFEADYCYLDDGRWNITEIDLSTLTTTPKDHSTFIQDSELTWIVIVPTGMTYHVTFFTKHSTHPGDDYSPGDIHFWNETNYNSEGGWPSLID